MEQRPKLTKNLDAKTFRGYYFLKEELVAFCRENGLPTAGGKIEITDRIARYLDTGEILHPKRSSRPKKEIGTITENMIIESGFVCSEKHRAFFRGKIGKSFSFHVAFQKWLKENSGKTYADAIAAYKELLAAKKAGKTTIDRQFEYNTYIRDFYADNEGKSLEEAIRCWKYKKGLPGHNRYERSDLAILTQER